MLIILQKKNTFSELFLGELVGVLYDNIDNLGYLLCVDKTFYKFVESTLFIFPKYINLFINSSQVTTKFFKLKSDLQNLNIY